MSLPRLSDENIESEIIRAYLYRDVLKVLRDKSIEVIEHEIKSDELYRPDLVAYRVYSSLAARWVVMLLCDVEDEEQPLPVGTIIQFPDPTYLRERIRYYSEGGAL